MKKEDAVEVSYDFLENNGLYDLDSRINYLISCRERGENVYIKLENIFQDKLYSADIDFNKAYMLCFGMPYEVYKHLMAIQFSVGASKAPIIIDSITSLFTDLKKIYEVEVEELRRKNSSPVPKM